MTAFGIFWGMLMLIILVGMGFGFNNGVVATLKTIPSNSIFYFTRNTSKAYKGFAKGRYWNIENHDLDIINARYGNVIDKLVPVNMCGTMKCSYEERSEEYSVMGTTNGYFNSIPQKLICGRFLNDIDQKERRKVCVIGEKICNNLYRGDVNPCGKIIKVGEIYYTIVGVAKETSGIINFGSNVSETVHVPLSTCQLAYGQGQKIYTLIATLKSNCPAQVWEDKLSAVLKEIHYINPDDTQALRAFNLADILEKFDLLFLGIYILIWIIGAGTLLAGLIGVSNIMLVTVKERTNEIGIRRAIGASPFTILSQIMSESVVITVVSGIVGIVLGVWILQAVDILTAGTAGMGDGTDAQGFANPQIPFSIAIVSFLILVIGGFVAGWMPAQRAMKIKAIDALRDE